MDKLHNHRLNSMFEANSIAIVGASARANSFGNRLLESIAMIGFRGQVFYINPSYSEIEGKPCFSSLKEMKNIPDLAILGVGAKNLEQSLIDAIALGVKSAVIYDSCHGLANDGKTPLLQRLRQLASDGNIAVCGGNGMGFINVTSKTMGTYYAVLPDLQAGGISLIAQSGSVFTVLALSDLRYRFDLVISPGQEIGVSIEEYIEYALLRPTTKVIALFMEGCRYPKKFQQVLSQAQKQGVPIIVCKVGKTEESKQMAQTHTGAIAGSETAYQALFDRYGVISVDSIDQMMNMALMCSQGRMPTQGGAAMMTDSGGLRELIIDRAEALNIPLAKVTPKLQQQLKDILPPSLIATNPLDCLDALTDDYHKIYENAFLTFSQADEVAILGLEADLRDDYIYVDELLELSRRLPQLTDKPCFFYSNFSQANNKRLAKEFAQLNLPVINGTEDMLAVIKHMLYWRDSHHKQYDKKRYPKISQKIIKSWQEYLQKSPPMDEASSLKLLHDFGIPVIDNSVCEDWYSVQQEAQKQDYPLVLKTAMPDIHHKSDQCGVILNIQDQNELKKAYQKLAEKLGNRVILQPMLSKQENAIELAFGCVIDKDFGAVIMVSVGGILIEMMPDRQFALAPLSIEDAYQLIEKLSVNKLLNGYRGKAAVNKQALAEALSGFSVLCDVLQDYYQEIDVNPVLIDATGITALDALVI